MKAISLVVVREGIAEVFCPEHVHTVVVDIDAIEDGNIQKVELPPGIGFEELVAEAMCADYVDFGGISAECHSDDRVVEVEFDATRWFQEASVDDILDLARCGWRGDIPSDQVAIKMADVNEEIAEMFEYVHIVGKRTTMGFECSVNEDDAMSWLADNRPDVLNKMMVELKREGYI